MVMETVKILNNIFKQGFLKMIDMGTAKFLSKTVS